MCDQDELLPEVPGLPRLNGLLAVDSDFVESVNHHVRTPLTVILGNVGLLIGRVGDQSAQRDGSLVAVQRAAQRLNDVAAGVCDLIDSACVDPADVVSVDLAELMAAEAARSAARGAQRGIRLLTDTDTDETLSCVADLGRLRRALHELVDNALAFAPDRSTVGVTAARSETGVCLAVSDQGPGIGPGQRARMVKPFERGAHPVQPMTGLGMGLALASAVAASHRGRLILSDSVGGGLRACLDLPADFRDLPDAAAF